MAEDEGIQGESGMLSKLRNSWEKNWPELHAALTGGLPDFILSRRPAALASDVPVFCYHVVDREAFARDLRFLAENGYTTIVADDLLDHLRGTRLAPPRSVVLSIDDGALNLFQVAFPLLSEYGMRAVAFVAPRFHRDSEPAADDDRPCSWSEIREMHESTLVDFQSHTYEHRYLPRWPEPIELTGCSQALTRERLGPPLPVAEDLRLARTVLERKLGKTVRHLAFTKYRGTTAALTTGLECGYEAFWWGYLPRHRGNRPGASPMHVSRVDGIYLRRLPGAGRAALSSILGDRYGRALSRILGSARPGSGPAREQAR